MASSPYIRKKSNEAFAKNIHKRGKVETSLRKKENKFPVGPVVLGLFLFIVIGSAIFELFGKK
ncbi:ribosome associated membrane RAMP4 [Piromyces finnis]|uniref:Stress-associated endoplasmic reticulum protein n=1 Tax=Piromyces finnis TaxID=1754191 RepID=A0A1Y1VDP9_9FUNG|nr:ribosome associated membrane RAMP4 [Piromyces finnis]|eukprot:ORX53433.1 ribosome associated membrane RAMP4 [Piromyces finnis]